MITEQLVAQAIARPGGDTRLHPRHEPNQGHPGRDTSRPDHRGKAVAAQRPGRI